MEENGRGCVSFAERIPVMWDLRSPINQAIAQRLVDRDGTFRSVEANSIEVPSPVREKNPGITSRLPRLEVIEATEEVPHSLAEYGLAEDETCPGVTLVQRLPLIVDGSGSGIVRNGDTQAAEVNRTDRETLSDKITDLRRLFDNSIPIPFGNINDGRKRRIAFRGSEKPAGYPNQRF